MREIMEHYLQHTELDTPTEKYIEVVFDIKKYSFKMALLSFSLPDKKLIKQSIIKQTNNKNDEYKEHHTLKQKLTKKQIEDFKQYLT
jgi:hypothetical protein